MNGQELMRRDWMFKLVGTETFEIGNEPRAKCQININAGNGFTYEYTLLVNGKQLQIFKQQQSKVMKTWFYEASRRTFRIVLGKQKSRGVEEGVHFK